MDLRINDYRPTVREYYAAEFFKIDANFSGIAAAQSGRPKRQIDEDRHILEQPMASSINQEDEGEGHAEADERVAMGVADLSLQTHIKHRFSEEALRKIIQFQMRERNTRFTKELRELAFMRDGCLPTSKDNAEIERNQKRMRDDYHIKFGGDLNPDAGQGLSRLLRSDLKEFIQKQKKLFESTASTENQGHESDDEAPPQRSTIHEAKAYFVPDVRWQRPS